MGKQEFFTDDYTGAAIEDERDVVEVTIRYRGTGDTVTSHLNKESVDNIIASDPDLESVFVHD